MVLLLGIAFAVIGRRAPDRERPNVLLIVVDTLRSDHLGCYGHKKVKTTSIDSLAQQGTLFKNAIAQVPLALPSHTGFFTSTYPHFNRDRGYCGRFQRTSSQVIPQVGLLMGVSR